MPNLRENDRLPPGVHSSPACPPFALLRAWQQQVLPADLANDVASHVESCALCPTLLDDLECVAQPAITSSERSRIRSKLPLVAPPHRVSGWRWYAIALATLALVSAGAFLAVRDTEHPEEARVTLPSLFPQAQTLSNVARARTSQPTSRGDASHIAKLAPPANLAPSLTSHEGSSSTPEPSPQQLAPAFDAYIRSDYSLATERFSQLAKQFPRSGIPFLYLGVTQLLINDDSDALFNLTRAEQFVSPDQKDTASWYRTIAALRTRASNASELLHSLCERKSSPYSQQACQFEKRP